jgi:hypothetical protein
MYYQKTNNFTRTAHCVFSKTGMVKSRDEIGEEIVGEYYSLIKNYLLRVIIWKTVLVTVFYGFFVFFLRKYVFSYTLNMNFVEVVLYPFAVSLPKIMHITNGGN